MFEILDFLFEILDCKNEDDFRQHFPGQRSGCKIAKIKWTSGCSKHSLRNVGQSKMSNSIFSHRLRRDGKWQVQQNQDLHWTIFSSKAIQLLWFLTLFVHTLAWGRLQRSELPNCCPLLPKQAQPAIMDHGLEAGSTGQLSGKPFFYGESHFSRMNSVLFVH